jgi:hypothetical protein
MSRATGRWLAAALAVALVAAWCAHYEVEPGFIHTTPSLDLRHPERWVNDPNVVAPGTLGILTWTGIGPLEARFGPVSPGDTLKLKLRLGPAAGRRPVTIFLDGRRVAVINIDDTWHQFEVVAPLGGRLLRLELGGGPPLPVHVSRVSATNVVGFAEGLVNLFLVRATSPVPAPTTRLVPWLLTLAVPLLLVLLVVWRRRTGVEDGLVALRGAVLELVPGIGVFALAGLVRLTGGARLVCLPGSFLLVIAVPAAAAEAIRLRSHIHRALALVSAGLRRLVALPGAGEKPMPTWLESAARRRGLDRLTAAAVEERGLSVGDLRRAFLVHLVIVVILGLAFARFVIHDFSGPMLGGADGAIWTYQGYYLGQNLSFTPLPRLDLVNDQLFYPYGGNNAFQGWVLDPALLSTLANRLVGPGPWYQLYFLFSVLIAAIGAFLLLVREHGAYRASLVAIAVSFCSFYAVAKFAGHFGIACNGWLTLNLLADWVLVRRFVHGREWSARLLAVRALLLVLVLGGDLSYMAGVALTSFSVCMLTVVLAVAARARFRLSRLAEQARGWLKQLRASFAMHTVQTSMLASATLVAAFFWVPIVLQINHAAHAFDLSQMPSGGAWANPLRMLIPVFPGFNPVSLAHAFNDSPEAWFAASPGIFFVLFALAGVLAARKHVLAWLPFVALLAMFLSFDPPRFAILRALPWFATARIAGRFSTAYPTILAILGLGIPASAFRGRRGVLLAAGGVLLLAVEGGTAYRIALLQPHRTFYHPGAAFTELVSAIRSAPGEALLDWPWCLAGGNGVGLCPFYQYESGNTMFLQQFDHKKAVANYFGRLHPDQIRPYFAAGWPRMFFPDNPDMHQARHQSRDFLPKEWEFLQRFFVLNDFCGILLYTDRLPAATVDGFHRRFGEPVAVATGTPFGRLEFIPKKAEWRGLVDREAGVRLTLPFVPPPLPVGRLEMGDPAAAEYLRSGWGGYEREYRSSNEHAAEIGFSLSRIEPLRLTIKANTFQRERVRILLNGTPLEDLTHDGSRFVVYGVSLPASLLAESNIVRFELPDAHSPKSVGINDDTRVLGLTIEWLTIEPEK